MSNLVTDINVSRPVRRLSEDFAAVSLGFTWWGSTKTLDENQKTTAAREFQAEARRLSASKKLINTKDEKYKELTKIKNKARKFWTDSTLPYPERGIRLIRIDCIESFDDEMQGMAADLDYAVSELNDHLYQMIENARRELGSLFNAADYPDSFTGAFKVGWEYPNVNPPEYLRMVSPDVYEAQATIIRARFAEAAELAEQAFFAQFHELVGHLAERLEPDSDGKRKKFKKATLENLNEFLQRFELLNVGCMSELEELIGKAKETLNGVNYDGLTNSADQRETVQTEMSRISGMLDDLVEKSPRRAIG